MNIVVVVPALDEAGNIGPLVADCLAQDLGSAHTVSVIVVDNGSVDGTALEAGAAGARVVVEPRRGYGYACAAGSTAATIAGADVVAFIDADHSCRPDELDRLITPIARGDARLVLGSRVRGTIARGAMPPHQKFGNWLSARLMRALYEVDVTDLGPYRAIAADLLEQLDMQEMTFGWPTEMMVKTANLGETIIEVPVTWQSRREGNSKVGGTIKGSVLAARHILGVTLRYRRS